MSAPRIPIGWYIVVDHMTVRDGDMYCNPHTMSEFIDISNTQPYLDGRYDHHIIIRNSIDGMSDDAKALKAISDFQVVVDKAESCNETACAVLRKLCAESCRQAPMADVVLIAEVILKSQRAAYIANKRD